MSKNQKTYLLLLAVVIIWGAVGLQIYNYANPDEPEPDVLVAQKFVPKVVDKTESYSIQPDYRDPFFGKLYKKPVPKPTRKKVKSKPPVVFPNIAYNGVIKAGKKRTYLITIGTSQVIFAPKQVIKGVELVRGNDTEVTLKYQGEKRKFPIVQ